MADVATLVGRVVDCVGRRHGLNRLVITTGSGVGYGTFDDQRPMSCTVLKLVPVAGGAPVRVDDARRCRGWDVAPLAGGVVVWSNVPKANVIESARFWVKSPGRAPTLLGMGDTGSLTWCQGFAYFVRGGDDNQGDSIMRWSPRRSLERVLFVPYSRGVLSQPICSGGTVAVLPLH